MGTTILSFQNRVVIETLHNEGRSLRYIANYLGFSKATIFNELHRLNSEYQAESERKRIIKRQQQGIALAKQQGNYHGRKPQYAKDDPRLQHAFKLYQAGMSDIDVARNTGIKRTTFIRYRKKLNIKR